MNGAHGRKTCYGRAGSEALEEGKKTWKRWPVGKIHPGSEEKYAQKVAS